jgi:outer membrane protein OmpA-like peptidoglycan-associated protein
VLPAEEPKLARTLEEVHKALAKLGNEFKARLYVAGYTDTVASREYNQDLSERRAMAIARWFSGHGLRVRACYQGFGEDSLAVQTPDETPEPRNRRTIHVLGNQTPPVSKVFPRPNWKCL